MPYCFYEEFCGGEFSKMLIGYEVNV